MNQTHIHNGISVDLSILLFCMNVCVCVVRIRFALWMHYTFELDEDLYFSISISISMEDHIFKNYYKSRSVRSSFQIYFFFIRPLAIIHFVMAFQIVIHKRIYNEKKDQQKKTHKKNVVNSLWHFTQYHSIKFIEKIIKFFVFFIFQCLLLPHWPKWNKIRRKKIISFLLPSQFIEKCSKFIHEWIYSSYFMHIKRNHRSSFLFR